MREPTASKPEVEGLLNLWELLHLCSMEPATTSEIMATVEITESSSRRLRKRAADRYGVEVELTEVERCGRKVPAFSVDGWGWQDALDDRLTALGA